jgi:hypothetical protein
LKIDAREGLSIEQGHQKMIYEAFKLTFLGKNIQILTLTITSDHDPVLSSISSQARGKKPGNFDIFRGFLKNI